LLIQLTQNIDEFAFGPFASRKFYSIPDTKGPDVRVAVFPRDPTASVAVT